MHTFARGLPASLKPPLPTPKTIKQVLPSIRGLFTCPCSDIIIHDNLGFTPQHLLTIKIQPCNLHPVPAHPLACDLRVYKTVSGSPFHLILPSVLHTTPRIQSPNFPPSTPCGHVLDFSCLLGLRASSLQLLLDAFT